MNSRFEPVGNDKSFEWFFAFIRIAPLFGFAIFFFVSSNRPKPPAIPIDRAFGCYLAKDAPSILLDDDGLHVQQEALLTRHFVLDRTKQGIRLTIDGPLTAYKVENAYRFAAGLDRYGASWSFYTIVGGKRYGVMDEAVLQKFYLYAADDQIVSYARDEEGRCRRPEG